MSVPDDARRVADARTQPPIDNRHVLLGATRFSQEEIALARGGICACGDYADQHPNGGPSSIVADISPPCTGYREAQS